MDSSAITVSDLSLTYRVRRSLFGYDRVPALKGISFHLERGEALGIIGRNGSGKSTLLRALAGIYTPDAGSVVPHVRSIALMTLSLGFDPVLTGRKNAIFGAMLLGASRSDAEASLEGIKEFSGLGGAFDSPVKSYSSGMLSRLAFSVAINLSPDVMLLDEVLAVGDEEFRDKAYSAMTGKIQSDQTTVLVSHSAEEIQRLCTRAILLEAGEIVDVGEPSVIVEKYRQRLNG